MAKLSERVRPGVECAPWVKDEIEALEQRVAELKEDAEQYRWLREQHWDENVIAVVRWPKNAVMLGSHCPSGELLDKLIGELRQQEKPDTCPDCGKQSVRAKARGGVECTTPGCGYWFCF